MTKYLTEFRVLFARQLVGAKAATIKECAVRFDVSYQTMWKAVRGKTWRRLKGAIK